VIENREENFLNVREMDVKGFIICRGRSVEELPEAAKVMKPVTVTKTFYFFSSSLQSLTYFPPRFPCPRMLLSNWKEVVRTTRAIPTAFILARIRCTIRWY
jgi:hypothetical protein